MKRGKVIAIATWLNAGVEGELLCIAHQDCKHLPESGEQSSAECSGCPIAWRRSADGRLEYFNKPEHGAAAA